MRKSYEFEGIVSLIIGIILIFLPATIILNILKFIIGGYLLLAFLPATLIAFSINQGKSFLAMKSLIMVILGLVIICCGFDIIGSIIGAILLIVLLIDLLNSPNKLETFKKDLIKYIISFVLMFLGINVLLNIGIRIIGIILIIVGIITIITNNKKNNNIPKNNTSNNKTIEENVIDVDFTEE
jgi:hypothetical protein